MIFEQLSESGGSGSSQDNADDVNEHHMHEYTGQEGKQEPVIRDFASVNEAMAAAHDEARERAKEIVRQWQQS